MIDNILNFTIDLIEQEGIGVDPSDEFIFERSFDRVKIDDLRQLSNL